MLKVYFVVILTYSISYSTSLLIQDNHNAVCMITCPEDYEEVGVIEGKQCEFHGISVQDRTNKDRLVITYKSQLENTPEFDEITVGVTVLDFDSSYS